MSILFFWRWELIIVTYNLWNKTAESIFQITRGQWDAQWICNGSVAGPPPGFRSKGRGAKTTSGPHFSIQYWMYAATVDQTWNGGAGHHWPSHWRRPWSVVRFTAAFFVSFIVTVFVPDSACSRPNLPLPKCLQGPPLVVSKKYFDITTHPEDKWPSQQNILFFISLFC